MIVQVDKTLPREDAINMIAHYLRRLGVTLWLDWDLTQYSDLLRAATYVYDLMDKLEAVEPRPDDYIKPEKYKQVA